MKWIPAVSKRTMFIYFTLLFLLYLFYALNSCLVDEKQFNIKYLILKRHISNYKSATVRFASLLGLDWSENKYRRLKKQNLVPVKRLPDALIIGVKKCGTRALLEFLRLHPDVRAAGSEVHFFDKFYHKGFEWYSKRPSLPRFEDLALVNSTVGWGGAWSVVDASWPPVRLGVYARPLRRWLRRFPRSRLLLISGERLVADPAAEMARVQEFLGLKHVITEKHFYFNSTKGFPCLLKSESRPTPHCLGKTKGRSHPHIDPVAIERLRDFYRPFNERFYQLSGINFGWP
ncbi:hypothetical protein ABMA27_014884 [Loxostege sticticalis]|uniref:Sulfotransferase domain-containing protein n=1 Tax=Loxostege sticticalis TaxID=481309 RepID=A0ABR3IAM3_LOXSC